MVRGLIAALLLLPLCAVADYTPFPVLPNTYYLQCSGTGSVDTLELSTALANASFTEVLVPIGTCSVNSVISLTAANTSNKTIRGVDRAKSIVQAAAASNLAEIFNGSSASGTLQNFTMQNLTCDANYANQTAANASRCIALQVGATYTNIKFQDNEFLNCGYSACVQVSSTALASQMLFLNNRFASAYCQQIYATNATHFRIEANLFYDYNKQATADCPAVGGYTQTGTAGPITNWAIVGNDFQPLVSQEFAFEITPATSVPARGINFVGNTCDGNLTGGCGVSIAADESVVANNTMLNGPFGDRQGFEGSGNNLVVADNTIERGQISLANNSTAYGSTGPYGMVVKGNTVILDGAAGAVGASCFVTSAINDATVQGNTCLINLTGSPSLGYGFAIAYYGAASTVANVQFSNNQVIDLDTTSDNLKAFSIRGTSSSHVTVTKNICTGTHLFAAFQFDGTATVDTDLAVYDNDWSGCNVAFSGTSPTGTGAIVGVNKLSTATQWIQPGGVPTISSGFGTSPTVPSGANPSGFNVNVGTGGTATSGVIAFPNAALNGWICIANDGATHQTASTTTTATVGVASAWTASTIIGFHCQAY